MYGRNLRGLSLSVLSLSVLSLRLAIVGLFLALPFAAVPLTAPLLWYATPAGAAESELRFLDRSENVQALLQQGDLLEKQDKWAEALSFYETAIKRYPNEQQLHKHQELARIQYDLSRRYADTSYRSTLGSLSPQEAIELYTEILLKVDSYYVKSMDWQTLVERGTRCVEIALNNKTFIGQNLYGKSRAEIATTIPRLREFINSRPVHSRHDAQVVVAAAAQLVAADVKITPTAIILEYVAGASGGLDPYSTYLTGDQLKDVYSQIDGNFVGIGIELQSASDSLLIVSVIPGSPAAKSGILDGDKIMSVDGTATKNLTTDQAAALLQGSNNSRVELVIRSGDQGPRTVTLLRQHVEVPSVDKVGLIDEVNAVGYLRLVSFQRGTSREIDDALWKLYHRGMKSLIIDVRGNPGGLLSAAVDIADKFVPEGTLVSTRGRSKQEDYDYTARRSSTWELPLVVLVDENSASASEIFAAAVRDHHRATLVGRKSYGKGSVQGIFPLARCRAGLRLTTAKFYSPNGQPISNVGVAPDVVVHQTKKPNNALDATAPEDYDAILQAGINAAVQKVATR